MIKKLGVKVVTGAAITLLATTAIAEDSFKVYGAIKLSIDKTSAGVGDSVNSVNNHDSRFGLKGSRKLDDDLTAVYQMELAMDVAERTKTHSGRNSFFALKGKHGLVAIGQYDTPFKKIRGNGTNIFGDTIADVRSLISVSADPAALSEHAARLDDRAKNAVWYVSPWTNNIQFSALYSADMSDKEKPDNKANDLSSASLAYKKGPLYVAVGFLRKQDPFAVSNDDLSATRYGASYKSGAHRFGVLYETSDNGTNNALTRDVYAVNIYSKVDKKTSVGIQYSKIDSFDRSYDTGASNLSIGAEYKYGKTTMFYAVASKTSNDSNAQFGLAQSGTGEAFSAYAPGATARGVSMGVVQKF